MPRYDMECEHCGEQKEVFCKMLERNKQHCSKCRGKMRVLISTPAAQVWKPQWFWLSGKEKLFIRSKAQLFEECRKRGKYSVGYDQECRQPDFDQATGNLHRAHELDNFKNLPRPLPLPAD